MKQTSKVVKNIKYFCRPTNHEFVNIKRTKEKLRLYSAYPIELGSPETAAHTWAVGYDQTVPIIFQSDNNLITSVFVLGLEHRGRGGRAYKVTFSISDQLTNSIIDNICVDLREDVLLDAVQNSTIDRGIVYGPFLWIKNGAQMKLVRENSPQHQKALTEK